jgi:cation:H+ antiporter
MNVVSHVFVFLIASAILWLLSGVLLSATERVARRFNKSGFTVAFIVLGFLTSIGELSVAVTAAISGEPQVSAGNLIGASLVLFLFIIPLLAVVNNGVSLTDAIGNKAFVLLLFVVLTPALSAIDGTVTRTEGLAMLLLYIAILYIVQKRQTAGVQIARTLESVEQDLLHYSLHFWHRHKTTVVDVLKICGAGILIVISASLLVQESLYFAALLKVPSSLMGLLLLSFGTNVPEIVIAAQSVRIHHSDIAFGDYLGSAAANTPIMGALVLTTGSFTLDRSEFIPAFIILLLGAIALYSFSRSKNDVSRREAYALIALYCVFIVYQVFNGVLTAIH